MAHFRSFKNIFFFSFTLLFLCLIAFGIPNKANAQKQELKTFNPSTLPPAHGYSHIVIAPAGRMVSISGQVAIDSTGTLVGPKDFEVQCDQVFKNLDRALKSIGLTFEDVIRTDMYVTTLDHLSVLRKCRARYLPAENLPASTLLKVESLFRPELMIEIAVEAVIPETVDAKQEQ